MISENNSQSAQELNAQSLMQKGSKRVGVLASLYLLSALLLLFSLNGTLIRTVADQRLINVGVSGPDGLFFTFVWWLNLLFIITTFILAILMVVVSLGLFQRIKKIGMLVLLVNVYILFWFGCGYLLVPKLLIWLRPAYARKNSYFYQATSSAAGQPWFLGMFLNISLLALCLGSFYFFTRPEIKQQFGVRITGFKLSQKQNKKIFLLASLAVVMVLLIAGLTPKIITQVKKSHHAQFLISSLTAPDESARRKALKELAHLKHPRLVEFIIAALQDETKDNRLAAIAILTKLHDEQTLGLLIEALADEYPQVRAQAALILGQMQSPLATEALIDSLRDDDESVRANVRAALTQLIWFRFTASRLYAAFNDPDKRIRDGVIWLLEPLIAEDTDKLSYDVYQTKARVSSIESVPDKVTSGQAAPAVESYYRYYVNLEILEIGSLAKSGNLPWAFSSGDMFQVFIKSPAELHPGQIVSGNLERYRADYNYMYYVLTDVALE